jgi:hypothetical protein
VPVAGNGAGSAAAAPGDAVSAWRLSDLITIGEAQEADPPGRLVRAVDADGRISSVRSGPLSFELRDTLTGYTAVTVSCEPAGAPGVPESGTVGVHDWDRLLGDLKTVLEADRRERQRRERQRAGPTCSSQRRPPWARPMLVPQVPALSGGQLSPDGPAPASPGSAVRMSRHRLQAVPGEREPREVPGEREPRAVPGERKPAASQCTECGDNDTDSGNRGTGIRGVIEGACNVTRSRVR